MTEKQTEKIIIEYNEKMLKYLNDYYSRKTDFETLRNMLGNDVSNIKNKVDYLEKRCSNTAKQFRQLEKKVKKKITT
jgi:hypothetical protein